MGVTCAVFQSSGTVPWAMDLVKMQLSGAATSSTSSCRNLGVIPSGPGAEFVFKARTIFFTTERRKLTPVHFDLVGIGVGFGTLPKFSVWKTDPK